MNVLHGSTPDPSVGVNSEVHSAVITAYYSEAVKVGATARSRAQGAQAAVTAFAATLLVALSLGLRDEDRIVRCVGAGAVFSWAVAAIFFMLAVGARTPINEKIQGAETPDDFIRLTLDRAKLERDQVDKRQKKANYAVMSALLLSFGTYAFLLMPESPKQLKFWAVLDKTDTAILNQICGTELTTIYGTVDEASLSRTTYVLELSKSVCRRGSMTVRMEKKNIESILVTE